MSAKSTSASQQLTSARSSDQPTGTSAALCGPGVSAGAPVFWASDGKQARLLIGNDDETRDVAVTIPFRVVDEVVRAAIGRGMPPVIREQR